MQSDRIHNTLDGMKEQNVWLRFQIYKFWDSGIILIIILLIIFSFVSLYVWNVISENRLHKGEPEFATIVGFGMRESRYKPGLIYVSAHDVQGLVGTVSVRPHQIAGCKIGDKISARRNGVLLMLEPAPCPITIDVTGDTQVSSH